MSDQGNQGYVGQRDFPTANSDYNLMEFMFRVLLGQVATITLARVEAVYPGVNNTPGTVDVLPLVNQQDSLGNNTEHATIYGLPYAQVQAGIAALVIPPVVGDIGVVAFASRDISAVKSTLKQSNPGSFRQLDYSDGIYLFTALSNTPPTSFIKISQDGSIQSLCPRTFQQTGEFLSTQSVAALGNLSAGTGATGTFTSQDGKVVTVIAGVITGIA